MCNKRVVSRRNYSRRSVLAPQEENHLRIVSSLTSWRGPWRQAADVGCLAMTAIDEAFRGLHTEARRPYTTDARGRNSFDCLDKEER